MFALSSCSRPKSPLDASGIVVWEQEDAQVAPYIDSVFEAFKKLPENRGLQIVRTHYQTEDLRSQFQAASLAGVPPDLIMCPSDTAGLFAVSGFIRPLDGLIDPTRYNKAVLQAVTLDGHLWGVPVSNGNHLLLFFNRKYAKAAPKDTAELFRFCENEAKAFNLDFCMAFDTGEPFWLMPWLAAFGGWPIDNKTPTLDTRAMRDAINFYLELKNKRKYVPPECDYNCMDSLFKEGKTAFIINGDWAISGYQRHFKKDFGLGILPKVSSTGLWPAPMVSGKYFMVSSGIKSDKLEVIKRLMEFYTNRGNQIRQFKELQRLPALAEAFRAPEITGTEVSRVSMQQISKGRPMSMATEMRAVWDSARNYLGLATSGKLSVEDATRKMQENAEQKIAEMNR
jgi:arabinogalactan oligomer/maltooligosaccharide transport system substrate-binding protein